MLTWLYSSRIYSFLLLVMLSFIFWSSDIFLFGCIMIAYFIKQEKPNTTSTSTSTTMTWDFADTEEEIDSERITLKHIQKRIDENTRELQLLSQYWPELNTDTLPLNKTHIEEEEKEKNTLKSELLQAHQTIEKLKSQLDATKIELQNSLEKMEKNHLEKNNILKQEKTDLLGDVEQLNEKLENYKQIYNDQIESNTNLKQAIHELQSQNDELIEHLETEEQKLKKMDLFVRENNKELQRVTDHALDCEYQIEELKLQLQRHQERLTTLETIEVDMMDLEQTLEKKNNEIIDLKEREEILKQEIEQLTDDQKEYIRQQNEKANDELKSILQKVDLEKVSLNKLLENKAKLTLEIGELSEQLYQLGEEKQQRLHELQQQQNSNNSHHHHHQNGLLEYLSDHSENKFQKPLTKRLASGRQERSSSIPRLSLSRSTSLKTNNHQRQQQQQYDDLERELYEKTQQCNEAHQVIKRLETIIGELQRQLDDSNSHLEDRDERLRQYFAS